MVHKLFLWYIAGVEASVSDENLVSVKNANIVVESQDDEKMQVSSEAWLIYKFFLPLSEIFICEAKLPRL